MTNRKETHVRKIIALCIATVALAATPMAHAGTNAEENVEFAAGGGYTEAFNSQHDWSCDNDQSCAWFRPTRSYCIAKRGGFNCRLVWNQPVTDFGEPLIRVRCIRGRGLYRHPGVSLKTLVAMLNIPDTRTHIRCRLL